MISTLISIISFPSPSIYWMYIQYNWRVYSIQYNIEDYILFNILLDLSIHMSFSFFIMISCIFMFTYGIIFDPWEELSLVFLLMWIQPQWNIYFCFSENVVMLLLLLKYVFTEYSRLAFFSLSTLKMPFLAFWFPSFTFWSQLSDFLLLFLGRCIFFYYFYYGFF